MCFHSQKKNMAQREARSPPASKIKIRESTRIFRDQDKRINKNQESSRIKIRESTRIFDKRMSKNIYIYIYMPLSFLSVCLASRILTTHDRAMSQPPTSGLLIFISSLSYILSCILSCVLSFILSCILSCISSYILCCVM